MGADSALPADLSGRIALVSGASRGVGRTYALALAQAGAKVLATARSAEGDPQVPGSLAEVVATARAAGQEVVACGCDGSDESAIAAAVETAVETFGGLDILVNNAVWPIARYDILAIPAEEWEGAFRVNVRAPYAFMRAVVPHMIARGGGAIVNITSAAALPSKRGTGSHGFPAYGVTKAALDRLTTYFAEEFADDGIAVNAISPGNVAHYTRDGLQPDLAYWGAPIVHLAAQRPAGGLTGRILHTYEFGRGWGPIPATPPQWRAEIRDMLAVSGFTG